MKKQWRSLEEYHHGVDTDREAVKEGDHKHAVLDVLQGRVAEIPASRRDFLKLFGFSFATAAVVSSCEKPVQKAIPYLIRPEEVTPAGGNYYASTFFDGTEYCSILVKVRDGRPIKIEGNHASPVSRGGTSARVQASVLNLYDDSRYKEPMIDGKSATWEEVDGTVTARLAEGGNTVLITPTVISPSTGEVIRRFLRTYPGAMWIQYDEVSAWGIREAHRAVFGRPVIPGYRFGEARFILSFDADFLGTWLAPVEFTRGYAETRDVSGNDPEMSLHIQVESGLTVTGTNADRRIPVTPRESQLMLAGIYNRVAGANGYPSVSAPPATTDVEEIVTGLLGNRGRSIVVSGSNDPEIQKLVAGINYMLGNYGRTLDLERTIQLKQGSDPAFAELVASLNRGEVDNLLVVDVNPVYSSLSPDAIKKAGFTLYMGSSLNETAEVCRVICPDHHYLEAWGDAEPVSGSYSLQQPCIQPIFNTRARQDSLLAWAGEEATFDDLVRSWWEENIIPRSQRQDRNWWEKTLQAGFYDPEVSVPWVTGMVSGRPGVAPAGGGAAPAGAHSGRTTTPAGAHSGRTTVIHSYTPPEVRLDPPGSDLALVLYTPVGLNDGRYANNPWLQELPDPVTKVCWDNYLAIAPADADRWGVQDEMVVRLDDVEVPVLVQPGQAAGTVSLALGYGRRKAGRVGNRVGVNGYRWVTDGGGFRSYVNERIGLETTAKTYPIARTQTHHSMEERPIVRTTTLKEYRADRYAGNHFHLEAESHHQTLYPEPEFDGFRWGLMVDLNRCTGCNNCVVACTAENNVATVGKEEVRNRRIMHWLRIDRYYGGEPENPEIYHQPVMCQHCDNAPCENVCPVSATLHNNEGLNQIAYVRCIGTKYCINNCPYRVRRFNWFKYVKNDKFDFNQNSQLSRLVLNPDVTVRERGVVEKCSFCVQRIQEKKMEAKLENRVLTDGEIQPACVQSCPAGALVFGNLNDPASRVSTMIAQERNYHLLEQLHTLPSVGYLTRVKNREPEPGGKNMHDNNGEKGHDNQS